MIDKNIIKKTIVIAVVFLVVVGILRIAIPPKVDVLERQKEIPVTVIPVTQPPINGVRVTVSFTPDKTIFGDVNAKNAEEALMKLAEKNNVKIEIKKYSFGNMITKIGDFENSKTNSWMYYVNGKGGDMAAGEYELKNGDRVEWKYEKNTIAQ